MKSLRNKFRGALLGALMGDCFGAHFEGEHIHDNQTTRMAIVENHFKQPKKINYYTDDTAMTKALGQFLIDSTEPNYSQLAKAFVNEYFDEPHRGYGQAVVQVFNKLKKANCKEPFKPASEQFDGNGSYGNGGGMRVSPIALFYHKNSEVMLDVAKNATKITHSNSLGIVGALLQCMAIREALVLDPKDSFDSEQYLNSLEKVFEHCQDQSQEALEVYREKLAAIRQLLKHSKEDEIDDDVILMLGNGIAAHESIPTAIYCFLRSFHKMTGFETDNPFRKALQYAISLEGDTDTIGSMAGAIAGAYYGEEIIETDLIKCCESYEEISLLAENLFNAYEHNLKD